MTIVSILDKATDSWATVTALATFSSAFLFFIAPRLQQSMNEELAGPPPDLRFGYTVSELNEWYDGIGKEGCEAYKKIAMIDLFPYMECYTLLLGGILVKASRKAGANPEIALLMPVVMLCDVVETIIPLYGCFLYPEERLPTLLIHLSSAASRLKWTLFIVSNVVLSFLFFSSFLKSKTDSTKGVSKKKE